MQPPDVEVKQVSRPIRTGPAVWVGLERTDFTFTFCQRLINKRINILAVSYTLFLGVVQTNAH